MKNFDLIKFRVSRIFFRMLIMFLIVSFGMNSYSKTTIDDLNIGLKIIDQSENLIEIEWIWNKKPLFEGSKDLVVILYEDGYKIQDKEKLKNIQFGFASEDSIEYFIKNQGKDPLSDLFFSISDSSGSLRLILNDKKFDKTIKVYYIHTGYTSFGISNDWIKELEYKF